MNVDYYLLTFEFNAQNVEHSQLLLFQGRTTHAQFRISFLYHDPYLSAVLLSPLMLSRPLLPNQVGARIEITIESRIHFKGNIST